MDYLACMNCSYTFTRDQSRAAKTRGQVSRAVTSGVLYGSVNVVMNRGKYFHLSKNSGVDICPACRTWHSTCPDCRSRQPFAVAQMFTRVGCACCGSSYGVP